MALLVEKQWRALQFGKRSNSDSYTEQLQKQRPQEIWMWVFIYLPNGLYVYEISER